MLLLKSTFTFTFKSSHNGIIYVFKPTGIKGLDFIQSAQFPSFASQYIERGLHGLPTLCKRYGLSRPPLADVNLTLSVLSFHLQ